MWTKHKYQYYQQKSNEELVKGHVPELEASLPLSPESSRASASRTRWRLWRGGGARPLWARWPPGTCYGLEKVLKYCFILCFQFWKLIEVCLMAKHGHFWWLSISALGEVCVLQMSGAVSYEVIVWFEFSPYWLICIDRVCQCGGGALKSPTLSVRDLVFCSSISFAL